MRFMHTMLRVKDLEKSLKFYCDVLGMRLLRRMDFSEGRFTLAFVGYADESEQAVLELTHNWDTATYELGDGYGHIGIGVEDVYRTCEEVRERGGNVVRDAGPMKGGTTVIAFIEDPDGYKIELLDRTN